MSEYHLSYSLTDISLCRKADSIAKSLELEGFDQKPSRASMAITDMLLEGSRLKGHTYLLWEQLEERTLQYLRATGALGPLATQPPTKSHPNLYQL